MKYFITGGAGFIGSTIVGRLLNDEDSYVTVFDNFCSGKISYIKQYLKNKRFKLIRGDLLDLGFLNERISNHDFVFHFAANPDIAKSMDETDLDLRLGIIATYNVLEAMRKNDIKKFIYSSGSGIYGNIGLAEPNESFGPLLPTSMYGASKLGAEALISAFVHMFDMQAWIFRFANVVGKNQTHGVGYDFIKKLKENPHKLLILGNGKQSKSYIHISDIINAILLVINSSKESINIFNVATGDYITVNEIAEIIVEEMNLSNVQYEYTGGTGGWKGDIPVVRFNLEKILNLGWKPKYSSRGAIRISIKEMLGKL